MKIQLLPTLLRSAPIAVFLSAVVALSASAQQPAPAADTEVLNDAVLGVLGLDKARVNAPEAKEAKENLVKGVDLFQKAPQNQAGIVAGFDAALAAFKDAKTKDTSLPPPTILLARMLFSTNNEQFVNAGRIYLERTATLEPGAPETYLLFGRISLGQGRLSDAAVNFERAQSLVAKNGITTTEPAPQGSGAETWTEPQKNEFLKQVYEGKVSVAEQRAAGLTGADQKRAWETAQSEVNTWMAVDKDDPMAHFRLARIRYMMNPKDNRAEALKSFQEAYKLAKDKQADKTQPLPVPVPEVVMIQLDTANGQNDEAKKAVADLRKIIDTYKDDPKEQSRIYTFLSQWDLQQGNPNDAQDDAIKAQQLDSEAPALKQLAAVMKYFAGQKAEARKDFEAMNQSAPDEFVAGNYLAQILAESESADDRNKAVRLAELNRRLNPNSVQAISTLGWAYHNVGRTQEALQLYQALLNAMQQAASQGQQPPPLDADTAFYIASVVSAANGPLDTVSQLLDGATKSTGAFKHRSEAESWLRDLRRTRGPGGIGGTSTPTPPPANNKPPVTTPPAGGTTPPAGGTTPPAGGNTSANPGGNN